MQTNTLGVVVGRFQVPDLHAGHHHLINTAITENKQVLIVVGSGHGLATPRNPLPYTVRREMLQTAYPAAQIIEHFDHPADEVWSARLDSLIGALFPDHLVTLYGSRDSFIPYYHGRFTTKVLSPVTSESGTDMRAELLARPPTSSDFRRGLIYSQLDRLPIPYQAVDIAIMDAERKNILLGQKLTDGGKWRFVGGFVDATKDKSLEAAARREAYEETGGLELGNYIYQGSTVINDWRYRKDKDTIMTSLFLATYCFGSPRATDDLSDLKWFSLSQAPSLLHDNHQVLLSLLNQSVR